jgi:hypothetical protein
VIRREHRIDVAEIVSQREPALAGVALADTARATDLSRESQEGVVGPLGSAMIRAALVAVPRAGTALPSTTRRIVRPCSTPAARATVPAAAS